jgi:hypothetical protein
MKTALFTLFLFLLSLKTIGQIRFEKGYFIDNNNQRVECFIKNVDWKNNPKEFEYKIEESGNPEKRGLETTKEFGILGYTKYIRVNVKIDRSPMELTNLSSVRSPIWSEEQLFLKVLLEGKASLYSYEEKYFYRYFYSVKSIKDTLIQQLVFKEYLTPNGYVGTNTDFHQQLFVDVNCDRVSKSYVDFVNYRQKELERYFNKYNLCAGDSIVNYNTKEKREYFNLKITPGIDYSSLSLSNLSSNRTTDFGSKTNFRIGLDAELILPFNKNKWGVVLEPTYQYFNSEKAAENVQYSSIEFPIGLRHHFYLKNEKSKLFLNAFFIPMFSPDFNSKINSLDTKAANSLAFGGGIEYKRLSAEIRYYTKRQLLNNYMFWSTDYQRVSLILGCKLTSNRKKG